MFVVLEEHLAGDHRVPDAVRHLLEALRSAGQIVHHFRHARTHGVRIEYDEIGVHPLTQQPAVVHAPVRGGDGGQLPDGFLQRHRLPLAYPVAEQVRLQRAVHDLGDVGARVRERDHRTGMPHHLEDVILVLVGGRLAEELLEVLLQRELDHEIDGVPVALGGDIRQAARLAEHRIEHEEPVPVRRARLHAHDPALRPRPVRHLHEFRPQGRVA